MPKVFGEKRDSYDGVSVVADDVVMGSELSD